MIEIAPDGTPSRDFGDSYAREGKALGRIVMPVTSRLRAYYGLKGLGRRDSHLDIGCGDCLFLRRSPCRRRVGLDVRYGDNVVDRLDFPDASFDNVSMLAVIEHLPEAADLVAEVARVLKPGGRFVVTTPRRAGEWLIRLYSRDVEAGSDHGHEDYYDEAKMAQLTGGLLEPVTYRRFLFGLNQLFVFAKPEA